MVHRNPGPHGAQQHLHLFSGVLGRNYLHRTGDAPDVNPVAAAEPFLPRGALYLDGLPLGGADGTLRLGQLGLLFLQRRGEGFASVLPWRRTRRPQQTAGCPLLLGQLQGPLGLL